MNDAPLLYDLTAAQATKEYKYHGGADYAIFVFFEILKKGYTRFDVVYNPEYFLLPKILELCTTFNIRVHRASTKSDIKHIIRNGKYKVFYSAMPYSYFDFNFSETKFVMVIHGLRTLEMVTDKFEVKYAVGLKSRVKKVVKRIFVNLYFLRARHRLARLLSVENKKIVTVSAHSKFSLLSHFPFLKSESIDVFYSPLDLKLETISKKERFFLLISANRWEKNSYRAICAFDQMFSCNLLPGMFVKVLGCPSESFLRKVVNKDKFEFFDYVENDTLQDCFRKAFAFIYPTLNEGFGYPPLIAMRYSTPVIASAISSVPEVCGNAALYFNPFSIEEIKVRILNLFLDQNLYKRLQGDGQQRVEELDSQIKTMTDSYVSSIFGICS